MNVWYERSPEAAKESEIKVEDLVDNIIHRTYCLCREQFEDVLRLSIEQVRWQDRYHQQLAVLHYTRDKWV